MLGMRPVVKIIQKELDDTVRMNHAVNLVIGAQVVQGFVILCTCNYLHSIPTCCTSICIWYYILIDIKNMHTKLLLQYKLYIYIYNWHHICSQNVCVCIISHSLRNATAARMNLEIFPSNGRSAQPVWQVWPVPGRPTGGILVSPPNLRSFFRGGGGVWSGGIGFL